jgi:hypothetical protein
MHFPKRVNWHRTHSRQDCCSRFRDIGSPSPIFHGAIRHDEARKLLDGVHEGLAIKENMAYLQALLFYKGERNEDVLETSKLTGSSLMALGYPIANFALIRGETARVCELFRKLLAEDANWAAFGFIAAEVELSRSGSCKAQ